MPSRSVNRCIAIAAHGRRCQQTTYRGSPYCWHHTQSRKVWAPSRMSAGRRRPVAAEVEPLTEAVAQPAAEAVVAVPEAIAADVIPIAESPAERIVRTLTPEQLDALVRFLEAEEAGVFRLDKIDFEVVGARIDQRLSRAFSARRSASG